MGGAVRGTPVGMWYLPQQLTEEMIVQFGNHALSGLAPAQRLWADQQAGILVSQGRFTIVQQSQLESNIRRLYPSADAQTTESLEAAVLYLALSKSAGGSFSRILASPPSMTLLQRDILGPVLAR